MLRVTFASAALVLAAGSFSAGAACAASSQVRPSPKSLQAKPLTVGQIKSRADGEEALKNAVAAIVVGALSEQFDKKDVSIKLDSIDVKISNLRDRIVSGEGQMQIEGDQDWVGFRYSTTYDTSMGIASYPSLTLGGVSIGEREIPNDSALVQQLDATLMTRIDKDFGGQPVRLQLDRITTVEAGKRFLRINASGIADFGRDGSTPAQVEALYDTREKSWLRVNYELGPTATWKSTPTAVAEG